MELLALFLSKQHGNAISINDFTSHAAHKNYGHSCMFFRKEVLKVCRFKGTLMQI